MQTIEEIKAEITEIEECLSNSNKQKKKTSFDKKINTYLEKKLKEKQQELVDIQK